MATLAQEGGDRIVLANEPPFRLGVLQIVPALRQASWPGGSRTLEPRVMQVLVALAGANGGIVGRDALIERCWDGRIVGENAINRVISLLRQLAAESRAFQIETVTKVGYRLKTNDGLRTVASSSHEGASGGREVGRRAALSAIAAAAAAATGGSAWLFWSGPFSPARQEASRAYRAGIESERRGEGSVRQAIAYYERAVRLDPRHAAAWGALARVLFESSEGIEESLRIPVIQRARAAADTALRLDRHNADALTARVVMEPWYRNWTALESSAREVLAVQPELNVVRLRLAISLANTGRLTDALALMRDVMAREPLVPLHQARFGWLLWQTGQLDEARRQLDKAYRTSPEDMWVWLTRFMMLSLSGAVHEALAMARRNSRAARIGPLPLGVATDCARALGNDAGDRDRTQAVAAIEQARRKGEMASFVSIPYLVALGQIDTAFEQSYGYLLGRRDTMTGERQPLPRFAERWTDFLFMDATAPMRADPRFPRLTAAIGLDDYWRATGSTPDFRAIRPASTTS